MEFRLARAARDRYGFSGVPSSLSGDAIVVDGPGAATLAAAMAPDDEQRRARIATDVGAIGLLHELGHRAIAVERRRAAASGGPIARTLDAAGSRLGPDAVRSGLSAFETAFPAAPVYRGEVDVQAWLARSDSPVPAPEAALEELALIWVALQNPAVAPYRELIDDAPLATTSYLQLVGALRGDDVSDDDPDRGRRAPARPLLERLLEPARVAPHSLAAQLRWIRTAWAGWLDPADLEHIDRRLLDLDEAARAAFLRHRRGPPGEGDAHPGALAGFAGSSDEPEAFSDDRDWMAELVLVAKSTYVWLSQLSRQHGREITRLDQVPDEELDELRGRGFTGLWLIGIWERSQASRAIKQRRGNVSALASAYSVADYRIADELGGDEAWRDLRDRAAARGLRLAADMVPNHMGIDSRWVLEHPERFISSPYPPFGAYRYDGPDLSHDGRVAIQLEDHYWDSSDAAVTFRRTDRASGETRYVYHGNDGTSFPWNDTAQLDYLRADVREAVIGKILDVARRFPVIRFDAAMVLAKRHIQRLWYPLPGQEGGIPSRGAAAIPADEFERRMPVEFWREVVDRVAAEAPDTLLLAEAFWLLEGYFVRTLGMHRVYNSAFMHLLRDERNAEYQKVIRETVAFDPRILGRYVNFMNNPDERSAADQFGRGDKYFGIATLLATLPGLPMFGHWQIEGYGEQYGMEFRHPMRDETPDEGLVAGHRREIFPLLHQRWRFAGASGFRQLTARDGSAEVDDVFAFANDAEIAPSGADERRSLVVYLNRYPSAHVRIEGVAQALGLPNEPEAFVVLHDQRSGLDFLRDAAELEERGLELALDGYRCHVFLGFEVVRGPGWRDLAWRIGLDGVVDAQSARRRLLDEPIRDAVAAMFASPLVVAAVAPGWVELTQEPTPPEVADGSSGGPVEPGTAGTSVEPDQLVEAIDRLRLAIGATAAREPAAASLAETLERLARGRAVAASSAVTGWLVADAVAAIADTTDGARRVALFDEWDMGTALGVRMRSLGYSDGAAWRSAELARAMLVVPPGELVDASDDEALVEAWLEHPAIRVATGWNEWQGRRYVSREAWEELVDSIAARDRLLAVAPDPVIRAAARRLEGRMAAAGYTLPERTSAPTGPASASDATRVGYPQEPG